MARVDLAESLTFTGQPRPAVDEASKGLAIFEELVAADSGNAIYSRNVALCEEKLGDACARLGGDVTESIKQRIQAWAEARDWYEKAGETFGALRERGTLTPTDATKPDELIRRKGECEQASNRLSIGQDSR